MDIKTTFAIGQTVYRINRNGDIVPFKIHAITIEKEYTAYHDRQGHFMLEDELYISEEEAKIVKERRATKWNKKI